MSRIFIVPEDKELAESGAMQGAGQGADLGEDDAGFVLPTEDFKALWQTLQERTTEEVLEQIVEQFEDSPGTQREVLTAWMAQELGYSRVWRRRSTLTREPLWEVLSGASYGELSDRGEEALAMIGRVLSPARASLHPTAALATLALWRHGRDEGLRAEARERLGERALPSEPEWLFEVVGVFLEDEGRGEAEGGRTLAELVELALSDSYWEVAALISALVLVHRYGRWYHSAVVSNLVRACDIASLEYPREAAKWLNYMVDAAIGGRLSFSWLERPLLASIRLSIDDREREGRLRAFAKEHRFDADHGRLEQIYEVELKALGDEGESEQARKRLMKEVEETVQYHPTRALKLMELVAMEQRGRRVGSRVQKMRYALGKMAAQPELDELESWLIGLYVRNMTLERHAADLVRRAGTRVDWEENPFAGEEDLEIYLVVSDYERAFENLTCKFEGVTMEHADKFAAERIKFFVQKRVDPSGLHRLVQKVFEPLEWLGSGLTEIGVVSEAIERGIKRFEQRIAREDLEGDVVEEYRKAGISIAEFGEIGALPVDRVEKVLKSRRSRRLLLGAISGGISGGLAPFSWGILSLADIPVLLSLTAEISSRFCWYFGFDPREHRELPLEILAVALGGTKPAAVEPMLVRQNLHEYVLRKSLVVGAVAHGGVKHMTGRGLVKGLEGQVSTKTLSRLGEMARRLISRNLQRRAVKSATSKSLPVVGALLGAALNTALLYDISEAAQAVLTDRFLERKYPEWVRHIAA